MARLFGPQIRSFAPSAQAIKRTLALQAWVNTCGLGQALRLTRAGNSFPFSMAQNFVCAVIHPHLKRQASFARGAPAGRAKTASGDFFTPSTLKGRGELIYAAACPTESSAILIPGPIVELMEIFFK